MMVARWLGDGRRRARWQALVLFTAVCLLAAPVALAAAPDGAAGSGSHGHRPGGEVNIQLPDLNQGDFLGFTGHDILLSGLVVCVLGLLFGGVTYSAVKKLPVHRSMAEISDLIYETCKAYLLQQGKLLLVLEVFIGVVIVFYFTLTGLEFSKILVILLFSLIGMAGSYAVAWYGIRINTLANSRTAFASLQGRPFPVYEIPLRAGMSVGMMLISVELLFMLAILLFIPKEVAGACFLGFAIGESLGAAALRIAGGIFTKIADIGSDLMKVVFKIKEDDARNPGVIADCTGDNAGDSVGPTADGFETYGVTGVALISFIVLAVGPAKFLPAGLSLATATPDQLAAATQAAQLVQVKLLVWIFMMRVMMVLASGLSFLASNNVIAKAKYGTAARMHFEAPLTALVWITSITSVVLTYLLSYLMIPEIAGNHDLWWQLSTVITCGTLAGAIIPELVKIFTSTTSRHVKEVVISSREGGASLNILSGLVAGNFSAYWLSLAIMVLMAAAYLVSTLGLGALMEAPAIFAFGLVAFGFLGMGPVTIAVDSYGPVTDNAQSVYELSMIEQVPGIEQDVKKTFGFEPNFGVAKDLLEENDGAGNTFKATAKPVLIGTAVVGATTMIFSIIMALTQGLTNAAAIASLSILHPPFLLGLITGGAVIYWFTGASTQAVTTGAYRAVEFIKRNIRLEGVERASVEDSRRVVEICTQYAQKGMFNIFLGVFFSTLAFAFVEPFFFIGYLISIALVGLFQAIFMANAGGAWDNAKKIVETELKMKGTELHAASVVGDTVGDPFKDTSSVAMNPVIKFTTLFGLLAVELGVYLTAQQGAGLSRGLAALFFVIGITFVWRSFYAMRIEGEAA
jgi:K(+)-stimulated pyrophosphate-energized sodium pump